MPVRENRPTKVTKNIPLPFPITLVIVAARAFTRQGLLDWRLALLACLVRAALADHSEYLLGYLFAAQWRLVSQVVSGFTGLSLGLVILAGGVYILARWARNH
jgi:membrane protein DedA with SNARE-associated domain